TAATLQVEQFIRRKARGWLNASAMHFLSVLVDDATGIVGLYAWELLSDREAFIAVVALHNEVKGRRLGLRLLASCVDEIERRTNAEEVYWNVHLDNEPAHAISRAIGAQPTPSTPGRRLVEYTLRVAP